MKKSLVIIGASVVMTLLVNSAFAATDRPCKPLMMACKKAGFTRGGHAQGKGMMQDCMQPILAGQTVPGVNVTMSPADMQACKMKAVAMKKQMQ